MSLVNNEQRDATTADLQKFEISQRIYALLETCTSQSPLFPPTLLYNEGWLLRLILDWFSVHQVSGHPLVFSEKARWFSEALLPSAFLARYRGDSLAEARTHADGVIGHFDIGSTGKADLSLWPNATQFVLLEAKISSRLSSQVKNVKYFDQAARNVACMVEVLKRTNRLPGNTAYLGFYLLAPRFQIERGVFNAQMNREGIKQKVKLRVQDYEGIKDDWYNQWFEPIFEQIKIGVLSWDEIIETIEKYDRGSGSSLKQFYERCLEFN